MKIFICLIIVFLASSCMKHTMQPSYVTEAYIKTKLQVHIPNTESRLFINTIYKDYFPTYKYGTELGIASTNNDSYFFVSFYESILTNIDQLDIMVLDRNESKQLLDKVNELSNKIMNEKIEENTINYLDYTVNENVYVSFSASDYITYQNFGESKFNLHIWFGARKYKLPIKILKTALEFYTKN